MLAAARNKEKSDLMHGKVAEGLSHKKMIAAKAKIDTRPKFQSAETFNAASQHRIWSVTEKRPEI